VDHPVFEVASVKVWRPDGGRHGFGGGSRLSTDALMVRMRVASLRELIQFAYGLQPGIEILGPDLPKRRRPMDASRGTAGVLVIDHVEKPAAN